MVSATARRGPDEEGGPVLEVLDDDECMRLLASGTVGRVGITIGAMPAIFPVNYGLIDELVVFRTGTGTKLRAALANTVVAFEVDEIDRTTHSGWSVLVVGMARELTGDARDEALALPLEPWAPTGRDHVVAITEDVVTGRRLFPRSHASPATAG